ncbi:unnamed protein product [Rhizoctonia solani]|uniref:J domain-containing protein n=1 Tax=Rhizoctonia solani TaxID=456999 RepID=A0A8H3DZP1_9AGAM|nr:unnamed protein product [Rhizoctonia solani]
MAHTMDSRSHFNLYPTPISTSGLPAISKPQYNYAYATPASTPTKPYPSYFYHYRPASPSASASPPSRSIRRSFVSVPNLCAASSSSSSSSSFSPPTARSSPLSVPPKPYSYPHAHDIPQPRTSLPPSDSGRPVKRESERSFPAEAKEQQKADVQQRQARLIAERDATLKRMAERQRQAEEKSWYEENQRMAAEAASKQEEEERQRAEEKLQRMAEAQAEEERKRRARKPEQERGYERGRPQTRYPAADADNKGGYRDRSRDGRPKKEHGFEREQRPERERTKSETRGREAREVKKDQTRRSKSPASIAAAWTAYDETCTEIMRAKPPKGKTSGRVTFYDIPWPILGKASSFHDLTNESIASFLLSPHHSQGKSPKARLRAAILIWHPDKFAQKVSPHIAESHRPAVSAGVDIVARIVTELISAQSN